MHRGSSAAADSILVPRGRNSLRKSRAGGRGPGSRVGPLGLIGLMAIGGCGDADGPTVALRVVRQGLLADAAVVELRFYRVGRRCEDLVATRPRPEPVLGPYILGLDDAERREGTTFRSTEIPADRYVVLADAISPQGAWVGVGCTEGAEVRDGETSVIRVWID